MLAILLVFVSHTEWRDDALCIYFAHMKNDQEGERLRDPRHIYANPLMPEICPILSLAIYMLCVPVALGTAALFPGSNQYDRYSKCLKRAVSGTDADRQETLSRGISPDEIGTHSLFCFG